MKSYLYVAALQMLLGCAFNGCRDSAPDDGLDTGRATARSGAVSVGNAPLERSADDGGDEAPLHRRDVYSCTGKIDCARGDDRASCHAVNKRVRSSDEMAAKGAVISECAASKGQSWDCWPVTLRCARP